MTPGSPSRFPPGHIRLIHRRLLTWYRTAGRELPWRNHTEPYHILVSECMLQQTQASRVAEKFPAWIQRFPTLEALAAASQRDVLLAWAGMGYNRRALNLHAAARRIMEVHGGRIPDSAAELTALPGVGRYSAHAVLCFAFRRREAVVDINIRRIFSRLAARQRSEADILAESDAWTLAEALLPPRACFNWNQALMDLGAAVCTARSPRCAACPLSGLCPSCGIMEPAKRGAPAVRETPRRIYRGRVVELLRHARGHRITLSKLGPLLREDYDTAMEPWLRGVVASLEKDGLVRFLPLASAGTVELAE